MGKVSDKLFNKKGLIWLKKIGLSSPDSELRVEIKMLKDVKERANTKKIGTAKRLLFIVYKTLEEKRYYSFRRVPKFFPSFLTYLRMSLSRKVMTAHLSKII